ncbi:hypothetical protein Fmac_005647 [Flemingia macrophylla]|uniref:Uncharacterized protein n=1 Tax=Flemingia macrophylla TaxID=520843 RepID=A0ABD1N8C9_9FABA
MRSVFLHSVAAPPLCIQEIRPPPSHHRPATTAQPLPPLRPASSPPRLRSASKTSNPSFVHRPATTA